MLRRLPHLTLLTLVLALSSPTAHAASKWDRLLAPQGTCGTAAGSYAAAEAAQEKAMRCLINWTRRKAGLPTLRHQPVLDRSARYKSADLLRCQRFEHAPCKGQNTWDVFRKAGWMRGYPNWDAAENIAWGTYNFGSPRGIMRAWLNSTGHRNNILARRLNQQGLDLTRGRFLGNDNVAVWSSHFGARKR